MVRLRFSKLLGYLPKARLLAPLIFLGYEVVLVLELINCSRSISISSRRNNWFEYHDFFVHSVSLFPLFGVFCEVQTSHVIGAFVSQ